MIKYVAKKNAHLEWVFNSVVNIFSEQLTGIQEVKELLACKKPVVHNWIHIRLPMDLGLTFQSKPQNG